MVPTGRAAAEETLRNGAYGPESCFFYSVMPADNCTTTTTTTTNYYLHLRRPEQTEANTVHTPVPGGLYRYSNHTRTCTQTACCMALETKLVCRQRVPYTRTVHDCTITRPFRPAAPYSELLILMKF